MLLTVVMIDSEAVLRAVHFPSFSGDATKRELKPCHLERSRLHRYESKDGTMSPCKSRRAGCDGYPLKVFPEQVLPEGRRVHTRLSRDERDQIHGVESVMNERGETPRLSFNLSGGTGYGR